MKLVPGVHCEERALIIKVVDRKGTLDIHTPSITPLLRLVLWLVFECFQIIEVKPYFRQLHPAAVRNVAKFSNLGGCRFVSWFRRQVGIFTEKEIPVIISGSSMFNSGNGRIENTSHLVIHHPTVYTIHYTSFHCTGTMWYHVYTIHHSTGTMTLNYMLYTLLTSFHCFPLSDSTVLKFYECLKEDEWNNGNAFQNLVRWKNSKLASGIILWRHRFKELQCCM